VASVNPEPPYSANSYQCASNHGNIASENDRMNKYAQIGIALFALLLIGGFLVLGFWDVPAPSDTVETELDDSRFPR